LLLLANRGNPKSGILSFSDLAKMVGQAKDRYNDEQ
jgi:hypothetical protein